MDSSIPTGLVAIGFPDGTPSPLTMMSQYEYVRAFDNVSAAIQLAGADLVPQTIVLNTSPDGELGHELTAAVAHFSGSRLLTAGTREHGHTALAACRAGANEHLFCSSDFSDLPAMLERAESWPVRYMPALAGSMMHHTVTEVVEVAAMMLDNFVVVIDGPWRPRTSIWGHCSMVVDVRSVWPGESAGVRLTEPSDHDFFRIYEEQRHVINPVNVPVSQVTRLAA